MERFKDKVVVVTGGANGLGHGFAEQFLKEGAKVAILDIEEDTMQEVFGGREDDVLCIHCDVSDYDAVQVAIEQVVARFGHIDILMNNAGITHRQSFLDCSQEGWLEVMGTNLNGVFYVGQAVARVMVDKGTQGVIVNLSSNSARKTITNITPYGPSKAAVSALTCIMALELAKYGIRVNALAPGTTKTRIAAGTINDPERSAAFLKKMPFGRYGEIHEAVNAALFLASDASSFITGETIFEEGGFSLL